MGAGLRKNETKLVVKAQRPWRLAVVLDKEAKNLFVIASGGITEMKVITATKKPVTFAADVEVDHAASAPTCSTTCTKP